MALGACLVACGEDPEPEFRAPAELYVQGYCQALCEWNVECDREPNNDYEYCMSWCPESQLEHAQEDMCFEQLIEYSRCRFDRLSCAELLDDVDDDDPGGACFEFAEAFFACLPGDRV